jgi:hypothetical protein
MMNTFEVGLQTAILLISASSVARITGMSPWHPACHFIVNIDMYLSFNP